MLAARSWPGHRDRVETPSRVPDDAGAWLTLQQAACEMNVSASTVRRRIRRGKLRNRIVPRRGGFAYLVYVASPHHVPAVGVVRRTPWSTAGQSAAAVPAVNGASAINGRHDDDLGRLRDQVERLSDAFARALRIKQTALPEGIGDPAAQPDDPYARYRWLARKRRWWPF